MYDCMSKFLLDQLSPAILPRQGPQTLQCCSRALRCRDLPPSGIDKVHAVLCNLLSQVVSSRCTAVWCAVKERHDIADKSALSVPSLCG